MVDNPILISDDGVYVTPPILDPSVITEQATRFAECYVCAENLPETSFPPLVTVACTHPSQVCQKCTSSWLSSQVESNSLDNIKCAQCQEKLAHDDIQRLASPDVWERYRKRLLLSYLSSEAAFHWCINEQCDSGQIHIGTSPICGECGMSKCIDHNVPWHTGLSCELYESRLAYRKGKEEAATMMTLERTTKLCPECELRIEKNEGCDHMTCLRCEFEFCWQCRASWESIVLDGDSAHNLECQYYNVS